MKTVTHRGFIAVMHEKYAEQGEMTRLIQESSAIGDYPESLIIPGSSYLWVGRDHHLNREEVAELITRMQHWLKTGMLKAEARSLEHRAVDGPKIKTCHFCGADAVLTPITKEVYICTKCGAEGETLISRWKVEGASQ